MKNMTKRMISLVMVMTMMASAVMAVDADITYEGHTDTSGKYTFVSGSAYTDSDLFDSFKKVMPGDKLTETVVIKNAYSGCDYIKVYMGAELHVDENNNPPKITVKETIAKMNEFLGYMTLTVTDEQKNEIFKGRANSLTKGFENGYVEVGIIDNNDTLTLDVKLDVDTSLGNEFANYIGEVDWKFKIEEIPYPPDDPDPTTKPTTGPTEPTTGPTSPTEPTEDIEDPEIPLDPADPDDPSSPDTGDHSNMLPYIVLFIVGLMGLILTSKKRKTN